jgi:hypothetical protein
VLGQGATTRAARLLSRADALLAGPTRPPGRGVGGGVGGGVALASCGAGRVGAAELALARGDLDTASAAAVRAVRGAAAAGSLRHLLKSRLLAGVVAAVRAATGRAAGSADGGEGVVAPTPGGALAALDAVAEEAAAAGLLPLARAALLAAADAAADAAAAVPGRGAAAPSPAAADRQPEGLGGATPAGSRKPRTGTGAAGVGAPGTDDPSGATARPPGRPFEGRGGHDRRPDRLLRSTVGAPNGPARRRHAAAATLSVIRARSEGTGRRLMGGAVSG